MVFGNLIYHKRVDRTDRVGIRSLTYDRLWQASRHDLSLDEEDAEVPPAPPTPSGMEFIGRETRPQAGCYRTSWSFTGVHGDGKTVTFKTRGNSPDYKFDPGFAQVGIEVHPQIQALLDKYEGYYQDGQIFFPLQYGGQSAPNTIVGSGALTSVGGGSTKANPMFGRKDYFRIEGTYSYRYCVRSLNEVPTIEGRIFEAGDLPGQPRRISGRNYLGAGAPYQRQGPVYEVMEIYWMSGDGGWPKPIYGGGIGGTSSSGGIDTSVDFDPAANANPVPNVFNPNIPPPSFLQ